MEGILVQPCYFTKAETGTGKFHGLPKATRLLKLDPRLSGSLLTTLSAQSLHIASQQQTSMYSVQRTFLKPIPLCDIRLCYYFQWIEHTYEAAAWDSFPHHSRSGNSLGLKDLYTQAHMYTWIHSGNFLKDT